MPSTSDLSWSQLTSFREECYLRFGGVRDLPIRSFDEELRSVLRSDSCVLDIGAGIHRPLKQSVTLPSQRYFSLDSDPAGNFDFGSFGEIPSDLRFDLMVANQVLEHLSIADAFDMVCAAYRHLVDKGHLLATVPSAAHPVRQWGDAMHVTAWPMFDLYGLLRAGGFHIATLARYNKLPLTRNPVKRLIVNIVCEVFRMDWCDSLVVVGEKRPTSDG